MKELKILKFCGNRKGAEGSICPNCGMNHTVTEEYLKREAIKWMNTGGSFDKFVRDDYNCSQEDAIYDFIQYFFNITDEERDVNVGEGVA